MPRTLTYFDADGAVNKFGAAPDGIQDVPTDIWDRANDTPTQSVWIAPTEARVHTLATTSAADALNGTGISSVKVYYLPDWDTVEATETVTGLNTTGIAMENSAVIIHRMKVIPQATTTAVGGNHGTITATAADDATITAAILPNNGQTEMAIYGVPSTQTAYMYAWHAQIDKATGGVASADFRLRVNENPDVQLLAFLRKDDISVQSTGTNSRSKEFFPPNKFPGPCIIKVEAIASADDIDGEAGFDLILVNK